MPERRNEHVVVEPARVVLQRLPAPVVIDAGPRRDRPAIVQLPVERAHRIRHLPPQVFGANLDGLGLQYLA